MGDPRLVARFRAARRDPSLAVLEGLHALKHALRFGADVITVAAPDPPAVLALADRLCPDVAPRLGALVEACAAATFAELAPRPPVSGVMALARRPLIDPAAHLAPGPRPVLLLEQPRHLGNLGAAIRVAAAADAALVLVVGDADPFHPAAMRGAAGLQFAVPCARVDALPALARPLLLFDAAGEPLDRGALPAGAVLAFGGERRGASAALRSRAQRTVAIPMRAGVSSLNLATAVAVALYGTAGRLAR